MRISLKIYPWCGMQVPVPPEAVKFPKKSGISSLVNNLSATAAVMNTAEALSLFIHHRSSGTCGAAPPLHHTYQIRPARSQSSRVSGNQSTLDGLVSGGPGLEFGPTLLRSELPKWCTGVDMVVARVATVEEFMRRLQSVHPTAVPDEASEMVLKFRQWLHSVCSKPALIRGVKNIWHR